MNRVRRRSHDHRPFTPLYVRLHIQRFINNSGIDAATPVVITVPLVQTISSGRPGSYGSRSHPIKDSARQDATRHARRTKLMKIVYAAIKDIEVMRARRYLLGSARRRYKGKQLDYWSLGCHSSATLCCLSINKIANATFNGVAPACLADLRRYCER